MPNPRSIVPALVLAFLCCAAPASASTADLSVSQSPTISGDPYVGVTATYTFAVTNHGPEATEATLTDTLGDAEQLVSATVSQGSCTQEAPVTCALESIAPGAAVDVAVKVTYVRESAHNEHSYSVAGGSANTDPDFNNDLGGVSFQVTEPEAPIVETPEAVTGGWSRTQSTLKLDAELSPFGTGSYYVQYGKTKAYGSKSAVKTIRGQHGLKRKILIDGLDMNTRYHYRVVLVVGDKTYRGKDRAARTLGKLLYPEITLKATSRSGSSTSYTGSVGGGLADAPGACKGTIEIQVYTTAGADLLQRRTTVRPDCSYRITVPFGTTQARRHGPKGSVIVQARFSGNRAVAAAGSGPDNP